MNNEIKDANLQKLINLGDNISFSDLFNSTFMTEFTEFENIQSLFEKSGYDIKTKEDFKSITDEEWDTYINENTQFETWKAMQIKAFEVFTDNILFP